MELQQLITPAVVSVIVTGILAPLLFYFLKRRDERQKRDFEIRYAEFKKYLGTLEEISQSIRANFDAPMSEIGKAILSSDPDNVNQHLLKGFEVLNMHVDSMRTFFSRSRTELRGLQLVCSDKLFGLVDTLIRRQEELLNVFIAIIDRLKRADFTEPEHLITSEMIEKANANAQLFDQVLKQMRKELRIDGT